MDDGEFYDDEEETWEMGPDEVLATAANLIKGKRAEEYGDAAFLFEKVAGLWSVYLGFPVSPHDVSVLMALLKLARVKANPEHIDSYVDAAGYTALAVELRTLNELTLFESEDDAIS